MLSKTLMILLRLSQRLGVRVLIMAFLALLTVLAAPFLDPIIPEWMKQRLSRDAVLPILNILASTMLAVTTFSLGVMVQAFQSASSQATPRAYRIMMQDTTTQTVLATFVGAFLFSLTSIVMFRAGLFDAAATVVIFGLTVLTIALIILAILRWIDHLSRLGSMDHTLAMSEAAARKSLRDMARAPALGANPLEPGEHAPTGARAVPAPRSGYLQFVDLAALQECLEKHDAELWLDKAPGAYLLKGAPVAHLSGGTPDIDKTIAKALTIAQIRSLEQDPRFGVMLLSEVALRALSPGINDPGTAIDVVHRLTRLLWETGQPEAAPPRFSRLHVPRVMGGDLIQDGFHPLIRDSAGRPEVMGRVRDALHQLCRCDWPELAEAARAAEKMLDRLSEQTA